MKIILILLILVLIVGYFLLNYTQKNLMIIDSKTGNKLLSFKVKEGEEFKISFIHSVSLSPVYEYYKIHDDKIVLYETDFSYSSAGLPTEVEDGEKLIIEKDRFRLTNMNKVFKEINYGVVKEWEFKLFIKGKEYDLSKMFGTRRVIITLGGKHGR